MRAHDISGYKYSGGNGSHAHEYLLPTISTVVHEMVRPPGPLFDLGCGNGSVVATFLKEGYEVTGVDPSTEGVAQARSQYPTARVSIGSAYDDLAAEYGRFPLVYSLEVIEHVYAPRAYAATLFDLVAPGGVAVLSTPYHGYVKNLVMALTGKMDAHFTALWDHGHIKFWSEKTLAELLLEAGFCEVRFERVGRIPLLAKSMIAICWK